MATAFEQVDAVPGFTIVVHRALTEHIMLAGAPRSIALGHFVAGWAAKRDPRFVEVGRRHLRIPSHLSV